MLRATLTIMLLATAVWVSAEEPAGAPTRAGSTNYTLDWVVLDANGGGTTASAGYTASVTVGQTVVGSTADATRNADLGFWFGLDMPLFADGFESGDTTAWDATVPAPGKAGELAAAAWDENLAER